MFAELLKTCTQKYVHREEKKTDGEIYTRLGHVDSLNMTNSLAGQQSCSSQGLSHLIPQGKQYLFYQDSDHIKP